MYYVFLLKYTFLMRLPIHVLYREERRVSILDFIVTTTVNILSGSAAPPDMTITMPVSDVTSDQQLHITMKSVGTTQYFLNPYTYTNNHPDEVRTEFYNPAV